MKCLNCQNELPESNSNNPKKFCGDKCRIAFSRKNKGFTSIADIVDNLTPSVESDLRPQPEQVNSKLPPQTEHFNPNNQDNILTRTISIKPENFGQDDCQCQHCKTKRTNKSNLIINHTGIHIDGQLNRVTLPGDVDYVGVCI